MLTNSPVGLIIIQLISKRKIMKLFRSIILKSALVILVGALVAITGCKQKVINYGYITLLNGNVTLRDKSSTKYAQLKDTVTKNTTIITGDMSYAVIQFGNEMLIMVRQNTELDFSKIDIDEYYRLRLNKGTVLSRILKLAKNAQYMVETQTTTSSVRGTTFSVNRSNNITVIAVGKGKVQNIIKKNREASEILEGFALLVSEKVEMRPINLAERSELDLIEIVPVLEDIEVIEIKTLEQKIEPIKKKIEELSGMSKDGPFATLEQIKARYGILNEVTLYSGKVYRGAIISRKNGYRISIPGQIITVAEDDVENVTIIK